jgi:hypothetical protein
MSGRSRNSYGQAELVPSVLYDSMLALGRWRVKLFGAGPGGSRRQQELYWVESY